MKLCFILKWLHYRVMHFSAERGLAIARHVVCPSVCLSLCLSVCNVGWSGPHRLEIWKLTAQAISSTPSLFAAQRPSTYSQGNMGKFGRNQRWGEKNWHAGAQKWQYLWNTKRWRKSYYGRPIGTHQRSFKWYHPRPPMVSPSPRLGFAPHPKL